MLNLYNVLSFQRMLCAISITVQKKHTFANIWLNINLTDAKELIKYIISSNLTFSLSVTHVMYRHINFSLSGTT